MSMYANVKERDDLVKLVKEPNAAMDTGLSGKDLVKAKSDLFEQIDRIFTPALPFTLLSHFVTPYQRMKSTYMKIKNGTTTGRLLQEDLVELKELTRLPQVPSDNENEVATPHDGTSKEMKALFDLFEKRGLTDLSFTPTRSFPFKVHGKSEVEVRDLQVEWHQDQIVYITASLGTLPGFKETWGRKVIGDHEAAIEEAGNDWWLKRSIEHDAWLSKSLQSKRFSLRQALVNG